MSMTLPTLLDAHPQSVPLKHPPHQLPETPSNALPDIPDDQIITQYQAITGSLIYLALCLCGDLAYSAMALGQYNANPTHAHLLAAKGILRYLVGTQDYALEYGFTPSLNHPIHGTLARGCSMMDADWATDQSNRKSISGYPSLLYCGRPTSRKALLCPLRKLNTWPLLML